MHEKRQALAHGGRFDSVQMSYLLRLYILKSTNKNMRPSTYITIFNFQYLQLRAVESR